MTPHWGGITHRTIRMQSSGHCYLDAFGFVQLAASSQEFTLGNAFQDSLRKHFRWVLARGADVLLEACGTLVVALFAPGNFVIVAGVDWIVCGWAILKEAHRQTERRRKIKRVKKRDHWITGSLWTSACMMCRMDVAHLAGRKARNGACTGCEVPVEGTVVARRGEQSPTTSIGNRARN